MGAVAARDNRQTRGAIAFRDSAQDTLQQSPFLLDKRTGFQYLKPALYLSRGGV